ncbi:MAG: hypothetical protein HQL65_10905 [Magnetococcales bacterium]|nr:hypothetical protein [Magnetococcales bacterium]
MSSPPIPEWIFIDYLDHFSSQTRITSKEKAIKLSFDILSLAVDDDYNRVLIFPAPAMAKCQDTAQLIYDYELMFRIGKIKYILSPEYGGDFERYIKSRISKLQNNFSQKELTTHFEFQGYTSAYWQNVHANLIQHTPSIQLVKERIMDCDQTYREEVGNAFSNNKYVINGLTNTFQSTRRADNVVNIMNYITKDSHLFQRLSIIKRIDRELKVCGYARQIILDELDYRFSVANAKASGAVLVNEYPGLTGTVLRYIGKYIHIQHGRTLCEILEDMTPQQIMMLSQQREWMEWIFYLRELFNECLIESNFMLMSARNFLISKTRLRTIREIGRSIEIATMFCAAIFNKLLGYVPDSLSFALSSVLTNLPSYFIMFLAKKYASDVYLAHRAAQAALEIKRL